jgi:cellulose biosynthesis protein BcsQ
MNIITSINAKGGCGKSTIAMNLAAGLAMRGHQTLLIDMDPQAQVTQWLGAGDGLRTAGTLAAAMAGEQPFDEVIQSTPIEHLSFIASSEGLEELGRQITDDESYATILTRLLATSSRAFEFVIIDSPNQISPIMENAIFPSDLFIVPFESTKAVRSYANFYKLLMRLRPGEAHRLLHVLSNLSRQAGLRRRAIEQMDLHGGSIFHYRPYSKGAVDMQALVDELLELLAREQAGVSAPALAPQVSASTPSPAVNESIQHHEAA